MRAAGVPLLMGMRESLAALAHWQRTSVDAGMRDSAALAGADLTLAAQLVQQLSAATLGEHAANAVLAAAGIPICQEIEAATPDEAMRAAEQIGYPVALKVNSPDILHKTEAGCVRLSLDSPRAVAAAFQAIGDHAV